ncbi:MAG: hypothetical protein GEV13_28515 [Rhodospirillales bacterium]|nr:hypothetical protein [Rhodospirillales bacterium]
MGKSLTIRQAAELMNVSPRLIHNVRKVMRSQRRDLIEAVERGTMTVGEALRTLDGSAEPPDRVARFKAIWRNCTPAERDAIAAWIAK